MQHRQSGSSNSAGPMGGGGPRRSIMNAFVAPAAAYAQPPQQPSAAAAAGFLQYPGMSVPMPSVDSSARSYVQQQQQPAQQMSSRFWPSPPGMETAPFAKQTRASGALDLEINDILGTSAASSTRSGSDSTDSQTMGMAGFEVNPFQEGLAASTADKAGASAVTQQPVATTSSSALKSDKKSGINTDDAEATSRLVDAAYSRFSDPRGEPDLSQRKLDEKNERCEFLSCSNRARVVQAYGKFCNRHVIVAPCGFPGCRDKAMVQAVMCEKHLKLGKDELYKVLANRPQNVPVCRQFGCFKNDQGRGYCRGHEKLLMATGRLPPHINKRRLNSAYTMCSFPDCNKHSQRNHLCRTHGNSVKKQAREIADRPGATESYEEILDRMQKEIRRCTHENCTKNSQRDRLCTLHYYEKHNLQKDGSSSTLLGSEATQRKFEASDVGTKSSGAVDIRSVEGTRCSTPGCGNLSYSVGLCVEHVKQSQTALNFGDTFPVGENNGALMTNPEDEMKQALVSTDTKLAASDASGSSRTTCSNLMCTRESYGRDYCQSCQSLFSPLMVSDGNIAPGSGYALTSQAVNNPSQGGVSELPCRVKSCGLGAVQGGLCSTHLRAFQTGSLSVDQLSLNSQEQHQREQELAIAAAAAAAAAPDTRQASPASHKKYLCKVDKCDKQAQKRGLCKRHLRVQGASTAQKPQFSVGGDVGGFLSPVGQSVAMPQESSMCRFPGCHQASDMDAIGSPLCLTHSKASFCWQPGCDNIVEYPQFCEFHGFRRQCAFEGCMYSTEKDRSGCPAHRMARRCRHDFCDKFAVGSDSEWCRIHQISCQESPCALCQLHSLLPAGFDENSSRSRFNTSFSMATTKGLPSSNYASGSGLTRKPRMM